MKLILIALCLTTAIFAQEQCRNEKFFPRESIEGRSAWVNAFKYTIGSEGKEGVAFQFLVKVDAECNIRSRNGINMYVYEHTRDGIICLKGGATQAALLNHFGKDNSRDVLKEFDFNGVKLTMKEGYDKFLTQLIAVDSHIDFSGVKLATRMNGNVCVATAWRLNSAGNPINIFTNIVKGRETVEFK